MLLSGKLYTLYTYNTFLIPPPVPPVPPSTLPSLLLSPNPIPTNTPTYQVSYNTALAACFHAGQFETALSLFDTMRSTPPHGTSEQTYPFVSLSLGKDSNPDSTHSRGGNRFTNANMDANAAVLGTGNARISRGGSEGDEGARSSSSPTMPLPLLPPPPPDVASYNTVMAAVATVRGNGGRDEAMALVDEMRVRDGVVCVCARV